jgi:hypothetical protein
MSIWVMLTFAFLVNMLVLAILAHRGDKFANSKTGLTVTGFSVVAFFVCGTVMMLMSLYQILG